MKASVVLASLCSLASAQSNGKFTYYNLKSPASGPCDLDTGSDGKIWFDTFFNNILGTVNPTTGKLTQYRIPYTTPLLPNSVLPSSVQGRVAGACVVRTGKDGYVYAATGVRNQFARINEKTKKVEVYDTGNPLGNLQPFNDAWPGDTGMFFSQTTANVISLFDYKTTKIKSWTVPTPLAGPLGMIVASDTALWFTELTANKIGRLNSTAGTFREYALPASLSGPAVMRAETQGRYLWFTALTGNALGRIDIETGEVRAYPNTTPASFPAEDTVDSKGNIWFSTTSKNTLNYLTPSTGKFTTIDQPDSVVASPFGIPPAADLAMHYNPGDDAMWFTELAKNRVGRYALE